MTHFDSLHTRSDLILDLHELPLRAETVKRRYRKRQLVNLMDDEDGCIGDDMADINSENQDICATETMSHYSSGHHETYETDNLDYIPHGRARAVI